MKENWYAVMLHEDDWDWGYGSYSLDEAIEIAKAHEADHVDIVDESGREPMYAGRIEIER